MVLLLSTSQRHQRHIQNLNAWSLKSVVGSTFLSPTQVTAVAVRVLD